MFYSCEALYVFNLFFLWGFNGSVCCLVTGFVCLHIIIGGLMYGFSTLHYYVCWKRHHIVCKKNHCCWYNTALFSVSFPAGVVDKESFSAHFTELLGTPYFFMSILSTFVQARHSHKPVICPLASGVTDAWLSSCAQSLRMYWAPLISMAAWCGACICSFAHFEHWVSCVTVSVRVCGFFVTLFVALVMPDGKLVVTFFSFLHTRFLF